MKKQENRVIFKIFILGILLRLILMPWFAHGDIIAVHRRVETIICGNRSLLSYSAIGVHFMESLFAKIYSPFVNCSMLSGIQESYYNAPFINRMLFFFKLPYLLFEIGYWYLMWIFAKDKDIKWRKIFAYLLAFNPVVIFAVYIFGRFEAYNLFLSAAILYLFKKYENQKLDFKKIFLLTILFAVLLLFRKSYAIIFPALLLAFGFPKLKSLYAIFISIAGYFLFKLFNFVSGHGFDLTKEIDWLKTGTHTQYFFDAKIYLGNGRFIYLFFLVLGLVFLWWLFNRKKLLELGRVEVFSLFSFLLFMTYFTTSTFHPHYFSWVIPFLLVLIIKKKDKILLKSFYLIIPFYILYFLNWGPHITFGLLFPISPAFRQISPAWFLPFFSLSTWADIGRYTFSGIGFLNMLYLARKYAKNN